ncbi:MaoC family dehydratase [Nocardia sp. CDC153]|uniref:MaoC family dehydratase n=1 Tax=Nocardia sp. CDC153 TaxID=3112167 RepID=UPI002DBF1D99|nr:MaoC family dehydratase [Nocardia sp. CDC153]MEC3956417.1 MaoC family dehydratase [Nocardia sp. CDC153]
MQVFHSLDELKAHVGQELGPSGWLTVEQGRIDEFAGASEDRQWIHVDPVRAAKGPFGATIAHGYLTLSLLAHFSWDQFELSGAAMAVNYGLNKVRFPAPVPVGSRLRAIGKLDGIRELADGWTELTITQTVEIEGAVKPACVAETLTRVLWS